MSYKNPEYERLRSNIKFINAKKSQPACISVLAVITVHKHKLLEWGIREERNVNDMI